MDEIDERSQMNVKQYPYVLLKIKTFKIKDGNEVLKVFDEKVGFKLK